MTERQRKDVEAAKPRGRGRGDAGGEGADRKDENESARECEGTRWKIVCAKLEDSGKVGGVVRKVTGIMGTRENGNKNVRDSGSLANCKDRRGGTQSVSWQREN